MQTTANVYGISSSVITDGLVHSGVGKLGPRHCGSFLHVVSVCVAWPCSVSCGAIC